MHDYRPTTFASPTYCELCGGFLWGLAKQGVRCNKCRLTAHKSCAFDAMTKCLGDQGLATLLSGSNGSCSGHDVSASSGDEHHDSEYVQRLGSMFWQQVAEEARLNDLVSLQAEQPLSLFQTLPANFMQFTAKLAPLSVVHRGATDLVFWRRPRRTAAAMCIYTMYCLRPNLLLATPLALMIAYIVFGYFNSGSYQRTDSPRMAATGGVGAANPSTQSLPRRLGSGLFSIVPLGGLSAAAGGLPPGNGSQPPPQRGRLRERRRGSQPNPYPQIPSSKSDNASRHSSLGGSPDEALPALRMSADSSGLSLSDQRRHSSSSAVLMSSHAGSGTQTPATNGSSAPTSPKPSVLVRMPSSPETSPRSRRASTRAMVDLGALLGVASFGSARYTDNVHTTQTMTGTYVSVYDWVAAHNHLVDWSDPATAWRVLKACICAQVAVMVVVYWVPWYLLFLAGGNLGLLSMSPHVRAFVRVFGVEFALYLHEWVLVRWHYLRHRFNKLLVVRGVRAVLRWWRRPQRHDVSRFESPDLLAQDSDDEDALNTASEARSGYITPPSLLSLSSTAGSSASTLVRRTQMVSVFENQRWWLGFGWIPRLGSSERAKWSNETGKRRYASIRDFMPEDGYEWADDGGGWEIDRMWALPVRTDEDGWIYTDNFWRRPAPAPSAMSSYTRRRRWTRRVRPAQQRPAAARGPGVAV